LLQFLTATLIAIEQPQEVAAVPYLLIDSSLCLLLILLLLYEKGYFFRAVRSDDLLLFLLTTIACLGLARERKGDERVTVLTRRAKGTYHNV
jgi:hypothetical protein